MKPSSFQRVYYFTKSQHAISNIQKKRIKVSRFDQLNDPYELFAPKLETQELRRFFNHNKRFINQKLGLICFSKSSENPVMWSHYADCHKGICLGFDIKSEHLHPVTYRKNKFGLLDQTISSDNTELQTAITESLKTKSALWSYEKEIRLLEHLSKCSQEDGKFFLEFNKDFVLKEVFLGVNFQESLSAVTQYCNSEIEVHTTRLAWTRYAVIKKPR